jgi:hypothetical protein
MKNNPLDHSRMLDVWIWSNKPEIRTTADYIFSQLQKKHALQLRRTYRPARLKNHLKVILTDLLVVHKEDPSCYLAFSRRMAGFVPSQRYQKIYLHPRYLAFLTDFLAEEKFIELHIGVHFETYNRMSRMKATPKLLRYFRKHRGEGIILSRRPCIILRNKHKQDIPYDTDTLEVKTMTRHVWHINKHLDTHIVSIDTAKAPQEELRKYTPVILGKYSKYFRVFNNSSFAEGGRFYGHFTQMISKKLRQYILIDGKETVELDYSCLHITLLYALEGIKPPTGDLYSVIGISGEYRDIIKKSFNIAINAPNTKSAVLAINEYLREIEDEQGTVTLKPKYILSAINKTHPILTKYLCSGYGTHLQRIDSELAENIMLSLLSERICVLCIHDSFIVNVEYKDTLRYYMTYHFNNRFHFNPVIK